MVDTACDGEHMRYPAPAPSEKVTALSQSDERVISSSKGINVSRQLPAAAQPLNGSDRLFVNWILQVQATGMFLVKRNQGTPSSIDELILYTKPFQISSKQ